MIKKVTICYFGLYSPDMPRNKVYMSGLRFFDVDIIECRDDSKGLMKFVKIFLKHWKIRNNYDLMIVGYGGYIMVPFAKLISRKPIIFDALCTFYESQIISRQAHREHYFKMIYKIYVLIVDWLAVHLADVILVESKAQLAHFIHRFKIDQKKCHAIYSGVDDHSFYYDKSITKYNKFTVLFRGRLTLEAGVKYIIKTAHLLNSNNINFLIIGFGWGDVDKEIKALIAKYKLNNLTLINRQLPINELRDMMLACHVSLGQFEDNLRLNWTIPHKAFESLAMRLPYITARTPAIQELLENNKNCLLVKKANPDDLAKKILILKSDDRLRKKLSDNGYDLYKSTFQTEYLGRQLLNIIYKML